MRPTPVPLEDVDLADLDVFARNEAWGMLDTLRAQAPVHWNPEGGGNQGFWSVTRFEDIERVDKDPETFTSDEVHQPGGAAGGVHGPPALHPGDRRARHQALRKLLLRDFSVARLAPLRGLPARPGQRDRRHGPAAGGVRLRRERSPPTSRSRCWPGCWTSREELTPQLISWGNEIVGATDPDYARVHDRQPGGGEAKPPAVPVARLAGDLRVRPQAGGRAQGRRR